MQSSICYISSGTGGRSPRRRIYRQLKRHRNNLSFTTGRKRIDLDCCS